jgi:hypothetical protein
MGGVKKVAKGASLEIVQKCVVGHGEWRRGKAAGRDERGAVIVH